MSVLVAVLAAGKGSRLGGGKLERDCAGRPLGAWSRDAVLALGQPAVWIAGPGGAEVAAPIPVSVNVRAHEGIGSSLARAAEEAQARGADALIVTLADMPLVGTALLRRLLDARGPAAVRYPDGRLGVPARFEAAQFDALALLAGDRGGNALLASLGAAAIAAAADELLDVDDEAGLAQAARLLELR